LLKSGLIQWRKTIILKRHCKGGCHARTYQRTPTESTEPPQFFKENGGLCDFQSAGDHDHLGGAVRFTLVVVDRASPSSQFYRPDPSASASADTWKLSLRTNPEERLADFK